MSTPKALMYLLMGLIGGTAVCGAFLALVIKEASSREQMMMLTMMVLALAAPVAVTLHRKNYRAGGMVLSAVFMVMWMCLLFMCYDPNWSWLNSGKMTNTLAVFLVMGIPTAVALMCRSKPWGLVFCWSLVGIAGIAGICALAGIWVFPLQSDDVAGKVCQSSLWGFLFGGTATALLVNVGRGDRRYFRWPGMVLGIVSAVAGVGMVWVEGNDMWGFIAQVTWLATATLGMVNLLLMTRQAGLVRSTKWVAIALTAVAGSLLVSVAIARHYEAADRPALWNEYLERGASASLFLAIGGILCMLVARTMLRLKAKAGAAAGLDRVEVRCPNCGVAQVMGVQGACMNCLLQFQIKLTEPKCPKCEHLLINLTSDRCPECGWGFKRPANGAVPA